MGPGKYILVRYSAEPDQWTEYLVFAPVPAKEKSWVICDKNGDIIEQECARNIEITSVRVRPGPGITPFGINEDTVDAFEEYPVDDVLEGLIDEVNALAGGRSDGAGARTLGGGGRPAGGGGGADSGGVVAGGAGPILAAAHALQRPAAAARVASRPAASAAAADSQTCPLIIKIGDEEIVHRQLPLTMVVNVTDILRETFGAAKVKAATASAPLEGLARLRAALAKDPLPEAQKSVVVKDERLLKGSPHMDAAGEIVIHFKDGTDLLAPVEKGDKGTEIMKPGLPLNGPPTAHRVAKFQAWAHSWARIVSQRTTSLGA